MWTADKLEPTKRFCIHLSPYPHSEDNGHSFTVISPSLTGTLWGKDLQEISFSSTKSIVKLGTMSAGEQQARRKPAAGTKERQTGVLIPGRLLGEGSSVSLLLLQLLCLFLRLTASPANTPSALPLVLVTSYISNPFKLRICYLPFYSLSDPGLPILIGHIQAKPCPCSHSRWGCRESRSPFSSRRGTASTVKILKPSLPLLPPSP